MSRHIFIGLATLLVVMLLTLFTSSPVLAMDIRSGDTVTIAGGEVVDDDLYIGGATIIVDGTINGDLWAAGREITINGTVNGGIVAAAETINVNGDVAHAVRLVGSTVSINGVVNGDLIVFVGNANVASTAEIGGDLLVGAGSLRINGPIKGDVRGGASDITITSSVGGDTELAVERLTIASTASIQGDLTYTSEDEADIQPGAQIRGGITYKPVEAKESAKAGPFAGIGGKVIGFLMVFVAGIVIVLVAPRRSTSIADSIRSKPWLSLGWGAVILFATPIAAIVVCITVIGIPVGLIALALYGIAIYLSQIFVGLFIGRWIIGNFREVQSKAMLVAALASGLVILSLLRLIPFLGFWIGLATALFALGALIVSEAKSRAEAQQLT